GKERPNVTEQLARDVLRRRRRLTERRIVCVQEFVIELIVDHVACPAFYFAYVDQHPGHGIDPAAENKIGDIVATRSVFCAALLAEGSQILTFGSAR
ncbi:MAG TPA: hypothetical protein VGZ24_07500, partial [Chthoniobacterales bacterium]|nr:hypothetical protein [Chthoniobacterales bacterium]